jgi:hypothetical protein
LARRRSGGGFSREARLSCLEISTGFLCQRVRWQEDRLAAAGARSVVFFDEPFLPSFGNPFFN